MKNLIYPHHSIINEVEVIFINGVKFEICEFVKEAYLDFNIDKSRRFFLKVEDYFYLHKNLIDFAELDANLAWRRYCSDKSLLKNIITDIENIMDSIDRLKDKSSNIKEGKYNPFDIKINSLKQSLLDKGIKY